MSNIPIHITHTAHDLDTAAAVITEDHLRQIRDGIAALEAAGKPAQPGANSAGPDTKDVPRAMDIIRGAMQEDFAYAWSWHCNVAMAFVDEGGNWIAANRAAGRFMKNAFYIDTATRAEAEIAKRASSQPDADEAAVQAMLAVKTDNGSHALHGLQRDDDARAILAVIRRGEVPAVWYGHPGGIIMDQQRELGEKDKEIAALRARVAELDAALNQARTDYNYISNHRDSHSVCRREAEELRARVAELEGKLAHTEDLYRDVALHRDRLLALSPCNKSLEAERDRLAAQVETLTMERDEARRMAVSNRDKYCDLLNGEHYDAVEALNEARQTILELRADTSAEAQRDQALADLAAERQRAENAEARAKNAADRATAWDYVCNTLREMEIYLGDQPERRGVDAACGAIKRLYKDMTAARAEANRLAAALRKIRPRLASIGSSAVADIDAALRARLAEVENENGHFRRIRDEALRERDQARARVAELEREASNDSRLHHAQVLASERDAAVRAVDGQTLPEEK